MWESESETYGGLRDRGIVGDIDGDKHDGVKTDGFIRREQSWYVSSDIPSDLLIKVSDFTFHLHKYPLLSRSGKMNRIIYETSREMDPTVAVELKDLPGGSEAFELAAKFCYGNAVDLTASNIAGLRCAAEFLEMTEDLEEGNLIFKTEAFLSYVVLSSWRDSIVVLKSCEGLSPWAENLQIVRRCSESIAWKACANPRGIRWAYGGRPSRNSSPKWAAGGGDQRDSPVPADWWFEDVSILRIDHFVRVVTAIKVKGMRHELIGAAIMQYAGKWLPGLVKDGSGNGGVPEDYSSVSAGGLHMIVAAGGGAASSGLMRETEWTGVAAREQRMVIESLISIIPAQRDSVGCGFLLRLLRQASLLKVAPALVTELEKRVGMQLEQAALGDLMIPAYYSKSETMFDVDLVQRLVEHFLVQEQSAEGESPRAAGKQAGGGGGGGGGVNAKMRVARLLDSYLTEVSRDRNLSLTKFQVLAEALPDSARSCDDGLYRAVDSYLKAHPTLTEHERKRLCRVMDCQKLSIDACMHAAQNERLPLRIVVQVLFSEQLKISNAIANSTLKQHNEPPDNNNNKNQFHPNTIISSHKQLLEGTPQSFQEGWAAAKKDINTLKFELETIKAKYLALQNEMDGVHSQLEKMTVSTSAAPSKQTSTGGKHGSASAGWTSGWRKLGRQLTKLGGTEAAENALPVGAAELAGRKGPRRWRNSIS